MRAAGKSLIVFMLLLIGCALLVQADTKDDARGRRKARRAQIEQIVKKGEAVEGEQGYLVTQPGISATSSALVNAENSDRKIGYEAIAKEHGMSLAEVQKRAAAALARRRAAAK